MAICVYRRKKDGEDNLLGGYKPLQPSIFGSENIRKIREMSQDEKKAWLRKNFGAGHFSIRIIGGRGKIIPLWSGEVL